MSDSHVRSLLSALEYPGADKFSAKDTREYRRVVYNLEDKFIRARKREARKSLEEHSKDWDANFQKYLHEDVDCAIEYAAGKNDGEVLEWLLHLATSYLYEDMQETIVKPDGQGAPDGSTHAAQDQNFTDWDAVGTQKLYKKLMESLHIELPSTTLEGLMLVREVLDGAVGSVAPAGKGLKSGQQDDAKAYHHTILQKHQSSIGFSTEDLQVDEAATLMRMLFIKDLRELQTSIDSAIVEVQEYTQNPKANAKLGLVGR